MSDVTPVILLCCGSFNPIHISHLRMFEFARDALHEKGKFAVVGGIISPVSDAYVKKDLASAKHRCAIIRESIKTSDWIRLDTWECDQEQWLETAKVLEHHQQVAMATFNADIYQGIQEKRPKLQLDNRDADLNTSSQFTKPVHVMLLIGADSLQTFKEPGLWSDADIATILGKYGVVVTTRHDITAEKVIQDCDIFVKYKNNIHLAADLTNQDCSATKIRAALKQGLSVKHFLHDSAINYIYRNGLYGTSVTKEPLGKRPRLIRKTTC